VTHLLDVNVPACPSIRDTRAPPPGTSLVSLAQPRSAQWASTRDVPDHRNGIRTRRVRPRSVLIRRKRRVRRAETFERQSPFCIFPRRSWCNALARLGNEIEADNRRPSAAARIILWSDVCDAGFRYPRRTVDSRASGRREPRERAASDVRRRRVSRSFPCARGFSPALESFGRMQSTAALLRSAQERAARELPRSRRSAGRRPRPVRADARPAVREACL
jgi:hypothetical protein